MSKTPPATLALDGAGIAYPLAAYVYDPGVKRVGIQAAQALDAQPGDMVRVLAAVVAAVS